MPERRDDEPPRTSPEPALRVIMRGLREIMAEPADGQTRLNRIVQLIAGVMVAEVCSLYLRRPEGSLELFASQGLDPGAVHFTRLRRGEGLVGRCAELDITINEPDARNHPAFSHRPETGEDLFHSMLAVPVKRNGDILGVLAVQNRATRHYSDDDIEVLKNTAMVIAEHIVSGAVAGFGAGIEIARSISAVLAGETLSEGIALGQAVVHEPRIVIRKLMAEDPAHEMRKLEIGLAALRASLDELLCHETLRKDGEHKEVLQAFRMLANDRGWENRLRSAVQDGLTAEAAVERVQNTMRSRAVYPLDAFWRERYRELDHLSDRLLRILSGRAPRGGMDLPGNTILIARSLGPAELIDYDRTRLKGLVIEEGGGYSHVAIIAKALNLPAVGQVRGILERVGPGDDVVIDAEEGEVHLRPSREVVAAYTDKVRFQARRQRRYRALRDKPAVTRDGQRVSLFMNAGLLADVPHLRESGADGIGLFRTEILFMLSRRLPRLARQTEAYRAVLAEAGERPVVFRTLDIGGDKVLPYLHQPDEQNPALGWRAIRLSLDRRALLRLQIRAFLQAAAGKELRLMIPMVTSAAEMVLAREIVAGEMARLSKSGREGPRGLLMGAMVEVPSLIFALDELLDQTDFVSIGSNDLLQFLFAADRTNPKVAGRYDCLAAAPLRALRTIVKAAQKRGVPVALCGEMAGQPLEAMALIGLGLRAISMAPASIGPVKTMILSLDARKIARRLEMLLNSGARGKENLREDLLRFARAEGVEISGGVEGARG